MMCERGGIFLEANNPYCPWAGWEVSVIIRMDIEEDIGDRIWFEGVAFGQICRRILGGTDVWYLMVVIYTSPLGQRGGTGLSRRRDEEGTVDGWIFMLSGFLACAAMVFLQERSVRKRLCSHSSLLPRGRRSLRPRTHSPSPLSLLTSFGVPNMGRSANKSVSRVYADVNGKLGPSWHEYGQVYRDRSITDSHLPTHRQPPSSVGFSRPLRDRTKSWERKVLRGVPVPVSLLQTVRDR